MLLTKVNNRTMFADRAYSTIKKIVQVVLPACSSLYFGLAAIWGLPYAEQVVGTLAVIATFLGICLGISSSQYDKSGAAFDGKVVVSTTGNGKKLYSLELDGDPENLQDKRRVSFRVEPTDSKRVED